MSKFFMRGIFATLFFYSSLFSFENLIVNEFNIINHKSQEKMQEIGNELFSKTGIRAYVVAIKHFSQKDMISFEKEFAKQLKEPFVLLSIATLDQKVDIYTTNLNNLFNKEQILSPIPWSGTILPILAGKNSEDKYSAAMINGYADLVDQIAKSKNVTLEKNIGNSNKNTINILRIIIYLTIIWAISYIIYKRRKNARKK